MIFFWLVLYLPVTYFIIFCEQKKEIVRKYCETYPSSDFCGGRQQRHLFSPAVSDSFSPSIFPLHQSSTPLFQHPNPFSYPLPNVVFTTSLVAVAVILMTTTKVTSISLVDPSKCFNSFRHNIHNSIIIGYSLKHRNCF